MMTYTSSLFMHCTVQFLTIPVGGVALSGAGLCSYLSVCPACVSLAYESACSVAFGHQCLLRVPLVQFAVVSHLHFPQCFGCGIVEHLTVMCISGGLFPCLCVTMFCPLFCPGIISCVQVATLWCPSVVCLAVFGEPRELGHVGLGAHSSPLLRLRHSGFFPLAQVYMISCICVQFLLLSIWVGKAVHAPL